MIRKRTHTWQCQQKYNDAEGHCAVAPWAATRAERHDLQLWVRDGNMRHKKILIFMSENRMNLTKNAAEAQHEEEY